MAIERGGPPRLPTPDTQPAATSRPVPRRAPAPTAVPTPTRQGRRAAAASPGDAAPAASWQDAAEAAHTHAARTTAAPRPVASLWQGLSAPHAPAPKPPPAAALPGLPWARPGAGPARARVPPRPTPRPVALAWAYAEATAHPAPPASLLPRPAALRAIYPPSLSLIAPDARAQAQTRLRPRAEPTLPGPGRAFIEVVAGPSSARRPTPVAALDTAQETSADGAASAPGPRLAPEPAAVRLTALTAPAGMAAALATPSARGLPKPLRAAKARPKPRWGQAARAAAAGAGPRSVAPVREPTEVDTEVDAEARGKR